MFRTVWVLCITTGIDDYKHRGECATSEVWVYSSKLGCKIKLRRYMMDKLFKNKIDDINYYNTKKADNATDNIKKTDEGEGEGEGDDDLPHDVRNYLIKNDKNEWIINENTNVYNITENDHELDGMLDLYYYLTESEFIPSLWTYTIHEYHVSTQGEIPVN